jgi:nitric oxide reductase subunit C
MYRITLLATFIAMLTLEPITTTTNAAPAGDAKRGEKLFSTLPCVSCHDVTKPWPGGDICPNLGNIATEAARLVRTREYRGKAKTAAEYIRESIVEPNAYIVPGAAYRTADGHSVMPKDFGATLSGAQIDDLVAYLLTRR